MRLCCDNKKNAAREKHIRPGPPLSSRNKDKDNEETKRKIVENCPTLRKSIIRNRELKSRASSREPDVLQKICRRYIRISAFVYARIHGFMLAFICEESGYFRISGAFRNSEQPPVRSPQSETMHTYLKISNVSI